jgi:SET domain-containing protein
MTYTSFVNEDMGFGLFAARNISAGEPLGIYTGIVRNFTLNTDYAWEYNREADVKSKDGEPLELFVDALQAGNNLRFVNHAINPDHLNVEQRYVPVDGVWYVMYITTNDVRMHDQLWVSYGEDYWAGRSEDADKKKKRKKKEKVESS